MNHACTENRLSSLAWVRERVAYTREQIAYIFGLQPNEAGDLILNLMRDGILSQCRKSGRVELADSSALDAFIGSGDYAFSYVGMYCHRGYLVYVLPKYYTVASLLEPEIIEAGGAFPVTRLNIFSQVIKVIARWKSKYERAFSDSLHEQGLVGPDGVFRQRMQTARTGIDRAELSGLVAVRRSMGGS